MSLPGCYAFPTPDGAAEPADIDVEDDVRVPRDRVAAGPDAGMSTQWCRLIAFFDEES
jgi:hypothetical protein